MQKLFAMILLAAIYGAGVIHAPNVHAAPINFDSFTPGSIHGQGGWTVADSFGNGVPGVVFDQSIVNIGGGNQVWRVSNAVASTTYSSQPFSQLAPLTAGEFGSSLWNDFGTNHVTPLNPPGFRANAATNTFYSAFDFKSATGGAQPGLSMGISASAKQSTVRMSLLNIVDNGTTGFNLTFTDVGPLNNFNTEVIATALAYDAWHRLEMYIEFVDGQGNDIVNVFLDGSLIHTGTTWERFYYGMPINGNPRLQAVDSLLFRMSSGAPGTNGAGFFIDNVDVSNAALAAEVPEPASLLLWGVVSLSGAAWGYRQRRSAKSVA